KEKAVNDSTGSVPVIKSKKVEVLAKEPNEQMVELLKETKDHSGTAYQMLVKSLNSVTMPKGSLILLIMIFILKYAFLRSFLSIALSKVNLPMCNVITAQHFTKSSMRIG